MQPGTRVTWWRSVTPRHVVGLDGERYEAVVSLDVSLEDLGAGAEDALEARPVQLDALERTPGHDRGRPGPVQQQGYLAWREKINTRVSVDKRPTSFKETSWKTLTFIILNPRWKKKNPCMTSGLGSPRVRLHLRHQHLFSTRQLDPPSWRTERTSTVRGG